MINQTQIGAINSDGDSHEHADSESLFVDDSIIPEDLESKSDREIDNEGFSISSEVAKPANLDADELIHAKAVIEAIKIERDKLVIENSELKKQLLLSEREKGILKEELTEARIDSSIYKQKYEKINSGLNQNESSYKDKLVISEARIKNLKNDIENLKTSFIIDRQAVSKREKDLESKIELMEVDTASQLRSREEKILELKRNIETLEFNMETTSIQNQGLIENKKRLSERLKLVSESIRGAGRVLDESIDIEELFEDTDGQEKVS